MLKSLLTSVTFALSVAAVNPLVTLDYTSYQGTAFPGGISQWLGVRYAAPPVGDLRFAAPIDPPANQTVQVADKVSQTKRDGSDVTDRTTAWSYLLGHQPEPHSD
jgi:carboxylesterase type B